MKLAKIVIMIFFVAAPAAITYANIFECGRGKKNLKPCAPLNVLKCVLAKKPSKIKKVEKQMSKY